MTYVIILSIFAFFIVLSAIAACMAAGRYDRDTEHLAMSVDDYDFACECALSTELADHSFVASPSRRTATR